jgi:guanosine-3',5'-bis(diphosphate) 3'-pyrophosphohydrolase
LERLLKEIQQNYPSPRDEIVKKAFAFAKNAHKNQLRESGEPYFVHPYEVAEILFDLGLDIDTVVAGLLHDVIEDTGVTYSEIQEQFGVEIAELVDGVTKLGRLEYKTKEEQQAENLRKMFLAMAKDIRVILIKLADRLHNMRTLKFLDPNKQKEIAQETLEIYAPLAHRLGIFKIKWELEDLALRYIDIDGYYDLVDKVAMKRKEREEYIQHVIETLRKHINEINIHAEIEGRPKHFYSIYKKMVLQGKSFDQIYDLVAVRVIVDTVKDCYGVLGIVHTLWKPIPGRFKDYIAVPKPNMYQSLHTTVMGPYGEPFEIQIRTFEMHRTAEYGIAAHWKYKEGRRDNSDLDSKLSWLRELLEWQNDLKDAREFMETLKIDLFTDEVFVFTPKGDVIDLPKGAIPLDFAYRIHSDIGNKCVGAKVNGKIVPLEYQLQTGDIVEILTSTSSRGPSRDWLNIVKTSQAKNKIKQWFKKELKEENIIKGKDMLEKEAKRQGYSLPQLLKTEWLESILKRFSLNSIEDMYAAVGYGGITSHQIITRLVDEQKKLKKLEAKEESITKQGNKDEKGPLLSTQGIVVKGVSNVLVRFSKCCNPVPGDDIIGYITRGRGVSIHRKDCSNLTDPSVEPERFVDVDWEPSSKSSYHAEIQIIAADRNGLLFDITSLISEMKIVVTAINARTNRNKTAVVNLIVEIADAEQLEKIIRQFKKLPEIVEVFRVSA